MKQLRLLLTVWCVLLGTAISLAVPANPKPRQYTQPDGTEVTLRLVGDEYYHFYMTDDSQMVLASGNGYYFAEPGNDGVPRPSKVLAADLTKRTSAQKDFVRTVNNPLMLEQASKMSMSQRSKRTVVNQVSSNGPANAPANAASSNWASSGLGLFPNNKFPTTGSPRMCVILVQFSDIKFSVPNPKTYFTNFANKVGFNDTGANFTANVDLTPTGSAYDFFKDSSTGKFTPQFDVYGPVTLSQPESYYGGNSGGSDKQPHLMIRDAVKALDSTVDFSIYDVDKDGKLDMVYVIFAGLGEANGGAADTIWPHAWNVYSGGRVSYYADGKLLDKYACSAELCYQSGSYYAADGIGTFCHEFSHVLGLADEYDINYGTAYNNGLTPGEYSLMDGGSYNNNGRTPPTYSIFQRNAMTWADIDILKPGEGRNIEMGHILDTNLGYAIETTNYGGNKNEFYLIENRQASKWDKALPGHGMLVWHIAYDSNSWNSNSPNTSATLQRINLVSANNTPKTTAGRPFPGTSSKTSFTSSTTPALKTNAGKAIDVPITNISENTSTKKVSFKVCGGGATVTAPDAPKAYIGNSEITASSVTRDAAFQLTLTSASGTTIKYITMTDNAVSNELTYSSPITISEDTEIEFWAVRTSDKAQSAKRDIKFTIKKTVATPTFTPAGGEVAANSTVALKCATSGATIYYTTNGSTPTSSSTAYSSPIAITKAMTIKAIAIKSGMNNSSVASASYTIKQAEQPSGDSFKIVYKDSDKDATSDLNAAGYTDLCSEGAAVATLNTNSSKVYAGVTGIKLSSSKADGTLVLDLASAYKKQISKVVINAKAYTTTGGNTDAAKLAVNGSEAQTLTENLADYTFNLTGTTLSQLTLSATKRIYVKSITFYIGSGSTTQTVATPTFSPAAGEVDANTKVSISCSTSGATIRYTTNGSTPTTSSAVYSSPITITEDMTIKAIAIKSGMNNSAVATAAYTIKQPQGPTGDTFSIVYDNNASDASAQLTATSYTGFCVEGAEAAELSEGTNVYKGVDGIKFGSSKGNGSLTLALTSPYQQKISKIVVNARAFVATNGKADDASLSVNGSDAQTLTTELADYTFPMNGTVMSSITLNSEKRLYVKNITFYIGEAPVATPVFSVASGEVTANTKVSLSCATSGATIRYTTNGSTPTLTSAVYSGPIAITKNMTIKAIALKSGMPNSAVATASYTLQQINASDGSFSIVFKDNDKDSTAALNANTYKANCEEGDAIADLASAEKVYKGKSGVKFSSLTDNGTLALSLANNYRKTISRVVVRAKAFTGKEASLSVNGSAAQSLSDELTDYNFNLDGSVLNTLTLAATNRLYVKSITFHYVGAAPSLGTVATPAFSLESGEVDANTEVNISCETSGASIHYTIDGSTPTAESALYDESVYITKNTTLKAVAVKNGFDNSEVATVTFTVPEDQAYDPDTEKKSNFLFDFTEEGYGMVLRSNSVPGYNEDPFTMEGECVDMTLNGQTRWWMATGGKELRFYKESGFTLKADADHKILRAKLTGSNQWEFKLFDGFADEVEFKSNHESGNIAVKTVDVELISLPKFSVSGLAVEMDNEIALVCTISQENAEHVEKYHIWVDEFPETVRAVANFNMLGNGSQVGEIVLSGDEITADSFDVIVPLTGIEPGTGVHYVAIRTQAVMAGDHTVNHLYWEEGEDEGSTSQGICKLDTDNGVITGITSVYGDDSDAIYYNMQGHRIASPQPGEVVIRVQNGIATKVRVK